MDAVSVGWSRMTWDGKTARLSTTSAGGNEHYIPSGYQEVAAYLEDGRKGMHLNVYMDGGAPRELLSSPEGRVQAVGEIVNELTVSYRQLGRNPYSGVTVIWARRCMSAFLRCCPPVPTTTDMTIVPSAAWQTR